MAKQKELEGAMRDMSPKEIEEMHAGAPPEGYAKAPVEETPDEATPPETPATSPAEAKAPVVPPATPPATPTTAAPAPSTDALEKIEVELQKPEGKEDLSTFSPREKAYFHQMRRDRKARQKAEGEADALRRENLKLKNPPPAPVDPLAGKADDDVMTVKEARELLSKQPPAAAPETPAAPRVSGPQARYLQLCEKEGRDTHQDFDHVMELADELISGDAAALKEIGEKVAAGENPALAMYDAIKKHKDFETLFPVAQTRFDARRKAAAPVPPASPSAPAAPAQPAAPAVDPAKVTEAKRAQDALETNGTKTKTTAHVSSAADDRRIGEYTVEELTKMSDLAFAKLPKNVRQQYLEKYG